MPVKKTILFLIPAHKNRYHEISLYVYAVVLNPNDLCDFSSWDLALFWYMYISVFSPKYAKAIHKPYLFKKNKTAKLKKGF